MPLATGSIGETGDLITSDRSCHRCGYNLYGLRAGGQCPECGATIRLRFAGRSYADNLTRAPMWYLRTITLGLALMAIGIFGFVGGSVLLWYLVEVRFVIPPPLAVGAVATILVLAWWAGICLASVQRPIDDSTIPDTVLDSRSLRVSIRVLPVAFLFTSVALTSAATGAAVPTVFLIAAAITALIGVYGLVPQSVYLSSLADWAGDTGIGDRLRVIAWSIVVFGSLGVASGLLGQLPWTIYGLFLWVAFWSAALSILALLLYVLCVIQLAWMGQWALRNSASESARDQRVAERRRQRAEEDARRIDAAGATPEPETWNENVPLEESVQDDQPVPLTEESQLERTGPREDPTAWNESIPLAEDEDPTPPSP